jgi:hypothetical protein
MHRIILPLIAALPLLTGCGGTPTRSVSLNSWQSNVEHYVKDTGRGDPASLGRTTLPDGRHGFAVIGDPIVKSSTDATGVLLGFRHYRGKPAFIYLVGLINHGQVTDIRLAAVSFDNSKAQWTMSPANKSALEAYERYKADLWHQRFPDRKDAPPEYQTFPSPDDGFTLDPTGNSYTATHTASAVKWTLPA